MEEPRAVEIHVVELNAPIAADVQHRGSRRVEEKIAEPLQADAVLADHAAAGQMDHRQRPAWLLTCAVRYPATKPMTNTIKNTAMESRLMAVVSLARTARRRARSNCARPRTCPSDASAATTTS